LNVISIRLISFSRFQGLSLRGVSSVPLQASSPSVPLSLVCTSSSTPSSLAPIDAYRHLYKLVGSKHLLTSIGDTDDGNSGIPKGVEGFGNIG